MSEVSFEIKQKTKIKVSLYGIEYELHKPTVTEAEALSKVKNDSDNLAAAKEFLATLGLPKEVSADMEMDHFNQLLDFVLEINKKK